MEDRLNYENIYYDLTVKGNLKPCLIIFHHINFIFRFSLCKFHFSLQVKLNKVYRKS